MRYFASLVKGKTYGIRNTVFKVGDPPKRVGPDLYSYLSNNPQFEISVKDEEELEPISIEELLKGGSADKEDLKPGIPKLKELELKGLKSKRMDSKERGVFELEDLGTAIASTPKAKSTVTKSRRGKNQVRKPSGV